MKNIIEKILKYVPITIIVIIILISTLLIGTPLNEDNILPAFIVIGIFSVFYYIIKREKIVKDKIDICIIFLALSSLLPLIFKTYVSLSGTIYYIMRYACILNMFLITKHECQKNPKYVHIILNTIIISILILCVLGLDELGPNYLKDFRSIIGHANTKLKDGRVGGLFVYANAMAALTAGGVFLCLGYIFSCKKIKIKLIYIVISLIMLITMILTYSRLVFIIFGIISIIYVLILCKKYKISKKIILSVIVLIGIVLSYIIIGLQIPDTLNVTQTYRKKLFNIQPDTDYKFTFDIEATSDIKNNFKIQIIQYNEYLDKVKTNSIKFDTFSGIKEKEIRTTSSTTAIYIRIKRGHENGTLNVKGMTINGKNVTLKYKILPTKLVSTIQATTFSQKSVWQRFVYIQDAFKLIEENWMCGLGGNAWRSMQSSVQEYYYYAKEVHSFPAQVFLENGILGFIACLWGAIYIIKTLFKEVKKEEMNIVKISAIIGISTILVHSIFDFDMSFFYIALIVFVMLATIEENNKPHQKMNFGHTIIIVLLIIGCIGTIYIPSVKIHYDNSKDKSKLSVLEKYYKLLPFDIDINQKRYTLLRKRNDSDLYKETEETLKNTINFDRYDKNNIMLTNVKDYMKLIVENKTKLEIKMDFVFTYIYDTEDFAKFRPEIQRTRLNNLKAMISYLNDNGLKKYANIINEQLKKEIEEKEDYILDYEKARYSKKQVEEYRAVLDELKEFCEQF